jgi:eukaryotic-like serine/threonine-protein kinase
MHEDPTQQAPLQRGPAEAELPRGTVIGRHVVLGKLGAGGMGVVYAAHDPELGRKVALKLVRPQLAGSEGRARMLREAQALAKLQHPSIVTIHDVGTHDGCVWLAMEYVEGATLGAWCEQKRRGWPEIVRVFVQVGRGVAAAHAAGLLHRDLKPDNIMIADDGRVRVMDFGVARPLSATEDPEVSLTDTGVQPRVRALEHPMTQPGALVGTPAYMAPEQLRGEETGPATDQFSFCATLWEVLFGVRPFSGNSIIELSEAILQGQPRVANHVRIPRWLRRTALRGLAVDPGDRWPSMAALVEVLRRGRARTRWQRTLVVAGVVGILAAGGLGWQKLDHERQVAACEASGAEIHAVWNEESRDRLRAAFVDAGVSDALATADRAARWLDESAQSWQVARTEACLDASVRGTWNDDLFERSSWCLDERRMEFEALFAALSQGRTDQVPRAVLAAAGLSPVAPCRDRQLLMRLPPPPAEDRESARAVHAELVRAKALDALSDFEEGLAVARKASARADELGWPPLAAAAKLRLGALLEGGGEYAQAEEMLENAYFAAIEAGAMDVAVRAANQLVFTVGIVGMRRDEALRWSRQEAALLSLLPDATELLEANHWLELAVLRYRDSAYDEAVSLTERALAVIAREHGPEHPSAVPGLLRLGVARFLMGDHEDARKAFEQTIAIGELNFGPDHPVVASGFHFLADTFVQARDDDPEESKRLYARAIAIREQSLGPDHPLLAESVDRLGRVHKRTGDYEQARALHEHAVAIWEQALGPDDPDVAFGLTGLAAALEGQGAYEQALAHYERARSIWEEAGPEHEQAYALVGLASVALAQRRPADAASFAKLALRVREQSDASDPRDTAEARFLLARALWDSGDDPARALDLAGQALAEYREDQLVPASDVAEIETWLRSAQ